MGLEDKDNMASADGSGVMRPSPQASPLGLDRFELDYLYWPQKVDIEGIPGPSCELLNDFCEF